MRTFTSLFLILVFSIIFTGCELGPDHSIRIKNSYPYSASNVKIGSVSYGTINTGSTTGYQPVDDGNHDFSCITSNSMSITGTVSISGNGTHKWTLTIGSTGQLSIKED